MQLNKWGGDIFAILLLAAGALLIRVFRTLGAVVLAVVCFCLFRFIIHNYFFIYIVFYDFIIGIVSGQFVGCIRSCCESKNWEHGR